MEIKKVERQQKRGIDQLEVSYIDDEGTERKIGFADAEEALTKNNKDGEEVFIARLRKENEKDKKEKEEKRKNPYKKDDDDFKRENIKGFTNKKL